MKISIIIPVYNKEKYLDKSIKSILNQTYENFELIIINDGSTDNSSTICHKFEQKDKRIKVIDTENYGVSNARNIGLKKAKGKYIQFIDADDYIENNMLENMVKIVEKYNPDIIINAIQMVNHKKENITNIVPTFDGITDINDVMESFAEIQKTTGIYGYVHNKFIKKSIIDNNDLRFDKNIWLAEDLDFCLDLYKYISNVYFCKKAYYHYLQEAENSSTTSNKEHDYLQQATIILKEKELLDSKKKLNEKNLNIIRLIITNFVISYMYQQFNYCYRQYIERLDNLITNQQFMENIICKRDNIFENLVLKLLLNKQKKIIYILFYTRTKLRDIYRAINK